MKIPYFIGFLIYVTSVFSQSGWIKQTNGSNERLYNVTVDDSLTGNTAEDNGSTGIINKIIDRRITGTTKSNDTKSSLLNIGTNGPNKAPAVARSEKNLHRISGSSARIREEQKELTPARMVLLPNYPNPFKQSTLIGFSLTKPEQVKLEVFNESGEKIETLINKEIPAGFHHVQFTAGNLPSGIYYYRIEAGNPSKNSSQELAADGYQQVRMMMRL